MAAIQDWGGVEEIAPCDWTCGYCGLNVAGNLGYWRCDGRSHSDNPDHARHKFRPCHIDQGFPRIVICPKCIKPTFFDLGGSQMPGVPFGAEVDHLPPDVASLYREARNCVTVSAFTASALATRKLLMNVAVSQGGDKNESFKYYVNFLASKGYVPPNASGWVDHIREKGNDATHEIPAIAASDAKDLLTFMEMILKLVFEFPNRVPGHPPNTAVGPTHP